MIENIILSSERDGLKLSVCLALPEGEPRALVQLAHGMAEHKARYLPFMEFLSEHGYAVIINDHRGHGTSVRSPGDLGYFYEDGARALVDDLHQITLYMKSRFPGRKLILFGHSMGSLAVRAYRRRYANDIDALVVCGSPGANPAARPGILLCKAMAMFKGDRYKSPFIAGLVTGGFSKAYPSKETANAWLSTNADNVRRYDADPLCGFMFTLNGYIALLELMIEAYRPAPAGTPVCPVHFVSGEDDPCAPDRKGFYAAVECMKKDGFNVTSKLYAGMRHEILNHTGKQAVYDDLLEIFDRWSR